MCTRHFDGRLLYLGKAGIGPCLPLRSLPVQALAVAMYLLKIPSPSLPPPASFTLSVFASNFLPSAALSPFLSPSLPLARSLCSPLLALSFDSIIFNYIIYFCIINDLTLYAIVPAPADLHHVPYRRHGGGALPGRARGAGDARAAGRVPRAGDGGAASGGGGGAGADAGGAGVGGAGAAAGAAVVGGP